MQQKRLLVFHPIIAPYRIDFFNELNKSFKTRICLFWHNLKNQTFDYDKILQQLNFSPIYLDKKIGPIRKGVFRQLQAFKPNIVITSEFGVETLLSLLYKFIFRKKIKIITICDDSYDMLVNKNQFTWKHFAAEKILLPFIDDVIVVEPKVCDYIQKKYKKGIYFPIIQNDTRIRNVLEKSLPISQRYIETFNLKGKKIFLFVGRLAKVKNLATVIPIFNHVLDNNSVFVIVGEGPCKSELVNIAKNVDKIIFAGRYEGDDLYAWYNVADYFILPSTVEPFGAVTNEALLGGCFVLVSNKAGSKCLIREGLNGFEIDPYDSLQIEHKIYDLINSSKCKKKYDCVKDSLMPVSFNDCLHRLLS